MDQAHILKIAGGLEVPPRQVTATAQTSDDVVMSWVNGMGAELNAASKQRWRFWMVAAEKSKKGGRKRENQPVFLQKAASFQLQNGKRI